MENRAETQESGKKAQNSGKAVAARKETIPEKPGGKEKNEMSKKVFGAIAAAVAVVSILVLVLMKIFRFSDTNILMKDDQCEYSEDDNRYHGTVLGSKISRDRIKSVTFMDTLEGIPDAAWDVSQAQDGTVMAWTKQSADHNSDDETYDLFIAAKEGVKGRDCGKLFQGYYCVEKIDFNNCFDMGQATDMGYMFAFCENLKELDVSNFETGQVTNMRSMFWGCASLAELDVSGFDTDQVTDMGGMFAFCENLTELDVGNFDTDQVTDMGYMFTYCENLMKLDVSGFDTDQVTTDMRSMFYGCGVTAKEAGLDIEYSNILMKDDQCEYFEGDNRYRGTVLGSEISRDSIKSVTFMDTLEGMPDDAWDVSQDQDGTVMAWTQQSADNNSDDKMYDLFIAAEGDIRARDCGKLFQGYYCVEKIDFNNCFDTDQVKDMRSMFAHCENLTELDISDFDTDQVTDMGYMFSYCKNLTELDVSSFDTGEVTDMRGMFYNCIKLKKPDISDFDMSQVTDKEYMFGIHMDNTNYEGVVSGN